MLVGKKSRGLYECDLVEYNQRNISTWPHKNRTLISDSILISNLTAISWIQFENSKKRQESLINNGLDLKYIINFYYAIGSVSIIILNGD